MGTAIVTGASAGIGAEFARRLAARGYDLVLVARRADRLDQLAQELGGARTESLVADLRDPKDVQAVADRAAQDDVTLLVNNAGINGYDPFAESDADVLADVIAVNVTAPTLLARAALPGMLDRGEGAIIGVASMLAFAGSVPPDPLPYRATYAATKGYMVTFTRTLAAEVGDAPVKLQLLCPGYTATEFHMSNGSDPVAGQPVEQPWAMTAADVVQASLVALDTGEEICIPGLDDPASIAGLIAAEKELRSAMRRDVARRYAGS
jgi:short-subunit dehydrogenase